MEEHPEMGEIVVCRVKKVMGYGAFVELLEYDDAKAFVHISEIASRWVKNIRNHVKEGQMRAAKVISVNPSKDQIDLSLTKVPPNVQRGRIEEWKRFKRNRMLVEMFAKSQKAEFDSVWREIAEPLIERHGSLQEGFEKISLEGVKPLDFVPEKWRKPFAELVEKSVTVPERTVKGVLELQSNASDGVDVIKSALKKGIPSKEAGVEAYYSGSGKYVLKVTSYDFKEAERVLNDAAASVVRAMEQSGGKASFKKAGQH